MELVTIKVFSYDHETFLYEPALKAAGIQYFLKDQKTIAIDPLVSNAIGGIKLRVKVEDEERARELVSELDTQNKSSSLGDVILVDGKKFEKILFECPKCDSDEVFMSKWSFWERIFLLYPKRISYCQSCSNRWS